jgi:NADPH:quinone reductase-like Zn-dependent oxidoreductase/imidazolonepropionase-like amidohydrolase
MACSCKANDDRAESQKAEIEAPAGAFCFVISPGNPQSRGVKASSLFAACALFLTSAAVASDLPLTALVGGTVINPADGKTIPHAIVLLDHERIAAVGLPNEIKIPTDARKIDCSGRFILPGYIDSHVHFFQSGDLFTRPDAVDLTSVRPYKDEVDWVKTHLNDTFARYLRSGITSVVDVGGPMWNFQVRKIANATAKAPRVAVAGPLISSVARPQLDLGDPPIVKVDSPEQGREMVRKLAAQKPDYIKIWYIVSPEHPVEAFRPTVHAVVEESHAHHLRVAVHATELEAARAAVEEGADLLVHSVTDKPVDRSFVRLLKEHGTILTPTLVVFERYGRTFAHELNLTPPELAWGNPEVIATLDVTKLPPAKVPERIKTALAHPADVLDRIHKTYEIAFQNLKTLQEAGIPIAAGTDAGNIGTIHGPALFREFQLMHEAGLTPMEILKSATATAARVFDTTNGASFRTAKTPPLGAIAPGNFADLVILNSNPLDDIAHASDIDSVVKDGVVYPPESFFPNEHRSSMESTTPATMQAVVAQTYGGPDVLKFEEVPMPKPKENEILVRTIASGVNPADPLILRGRYAKEFGTHLPLVLGYDVAGVVVKTGAKVTRLKAGDPVYAFLLFGGGWAQYCLTNEGEAALKPRSIDFVTAAAVPLTALTAWQALIDTAHLSAGQTVLIQGGSGGVGSFAIQIAKARGAKVIATASTANQDLLKQLGADVAVDYKKTKFEDVARNVDVVLDVVGDETLARSYGVVKKGGIVVSIVSRLDQAALSKYGIRGAFLASHPDAAELAEISRLIDAGQIKPVVSQTLPLSAALQATTQAETHHTRGKVVLRIAPEPSS